MIPTSLCILRILQAGMLQFLLTEEILTEPVKVPQREGKSSSGRRDREVQCQQHNLGLCLLSPQSPCWLKPAETELSRAQDHILALLLCTTKPFPSTLQSPGSFSQQGSGAVNVSTNPQGKAGKGEGREGKEKVKRNEHLTRALSQSSCGTGRPGKVAGGSRDRGRESWGWQGSC